MPVRVLHLEDGAADAELIGRSLREEVPDCAVSWVRTRSAFEAVIVAQQFDLVLADYAIPGYGGLDALRYALTHAPETPVIMVSGSLSAAEAVACMRAGASDYVLKDRLERLGPAVRRALLEAEASRQRRRVEAALARSEARLRLALQTSQISVWDYDVTSGRVEFTSSLGSILCYSEDEVPSHTEAWEALTHRDDLRRVKAALARHYRGQSAAVDIEYRVRAKSGEWRWLHTLGRTLTRDARGRATHMSGTHQDVTARRRTEELLRLQVSAIAAATNAILIVDARAPDWPIVQVNRAFERITGYSAEEAIGRNSRFLQAGDRSQPDLDRLRVALAAGKEATVMLRNYRKDGTLFWNKLTVSPVRSDRRGITHFVGVQSDVTELKNYQIELEYRATHDTLTGVANLSLLNDRLDHAIAFGERAGRRFALLHVGLDRFKLVNDSLGHESGDALLKHTAARLRSAIRESDTIARLGGDVFAIVMNDIEHAAAAASVAHKILSDLGEPLTIEGHEIVTAASIGICLYPEDGIATVTLLKNAELAMYRAKRGGGQQVCFYTEDQTANALERLRLEGHLRRALALEEFELHYQPRANLNTGTVTSLEALIRWRRGDEGLIAPASFIPLAEDTGLIVPIGLWVLRTACAQMRLWRDQGHSDLRVAVNLSPRQFRQPDLVQAITAILAEAGLDARHLELEITEGVAMHDPAATQRVLEELSDMGVAIAIDDFGTGYSSLGYLQRFSLDYLKIDQSFVSGLATRAHDEHLVRSIIALAHNMDLGVIAEGVETEEQRTLLKTWGCDEAQGYLLCRPQPAASLEGVLGSAI